MKKNKKVLLLLLAIILVVTVFPLTAFAQSGMALPDVLNFKIYLIDKDSNALANYAVTVDDTNKGITNSDGVATINGIYLSEIDTFKLSDPNGKNIGAFNLTYIPETQTGIANTLSITGAFILQYSAPNETVYMHMMYDPKSSTGFPFRPLDASDNPLSPGKKAAPKPTDPPTNPQLVGYVIDSDGMRVKHGTVISKNDETGGSLTATTDANGMFVLSGISKGKHTMQFINEESGYTDSLKMNVKVGDATQIVKKSNELLEVDIKKGADVIYANFQLGADDNTHILEVSNKVLASPATKDPTPEPTPEPIVVPTDVPQPVTTEQPAEPSATVEPTPEPTVEPTAEPTAEPTTTPETQKSGIDTTLIIVIAIIAVAVIIVVALVLRNKRR